MRITNGMISNKMMLNINKNMTVVDSLYTQWASKKKIQYASEDPILASRVLKFRATVSENAQYIKNADQAASWMEVTEAAYNEVDKILTQISELTAANNGTKSYADKQKIAVQIEALTKELGLAMNATYTGRYIFSGFRTDEPAALLTDDSTLAYQDITQNFTLNDVETVSTYQKLTDGARATVTENVKILKLAYTGCDNVKVDGVSVTAVKTLGDADAYTPGVNEIYYIAETGELVLGENAASQTDFKVTYDKTGFKTGDLNPKVYFTCTDSAGKTYTMDNQNIKYEFGVGASFAINSLAKDVVTDNLYADLLNFCSSMANVSVSTLEEAKRKIAADAAAAVPPVTLTADELTEQAKAQIALEEEDAATVMENRFSNLITLMENHTNTFLTSETDLGTRGARLELVQSRLETEKEVYTELMSNNEDANLIEVAMLLSNAEAAYQASMQIGMNIMQISLVNFL